MERSDHKPHDRTELETNLVSEGMRTLIDQTDGGVSHRGSQLVEDENPGMYKQIRWRA